MLVNGQNVTAYGLFVEHYQKHNLVWNGNGGRVYFFQNEMPYDPPSQSAWRSGAGRVFSFMICTVTGIGNLCKTLFDRRLGSGVAFPSVGRCAEPAKAGGSDLQPDHIEPASSFVAATWARSLNSR